MLHSFFEGPEKKVELSVVEGFGSLRAMGESFWRAVVKASQADVISKRENDHFDAYLLSESSLFVYDDFATMITCGRTRLIDAVDAMLSRIPTESVAMLMYERKNEHFPEKQPSTFFEDARRLNERLPGRALLFGEEHEHVIRLFHTTRDHTPDPKDTTLEVLMHGIDEGRAAAFCGIAETDENTVAARLGLDRILPGFDIDEYVFKPSGYSLNAINGHDYYTVHVTPERFGSYVSFETNFDFREQPSGLVRRVVELFRPDSFDVMAFVPGHDPLMVDAPGYRLRRQVHEPVGGYEVSFQHFYGPSCDTQRAHVIDLGAR